MILFLAGATVGGFIGVSIMCLMQIGREETKKEETLCSMK